MLARGSELTCRRFWLGLGCWTRLFICSEVPRLRRLRYQEGRIFPTYSCGEKIKGIYTQSQDRIQQKMHAVDTKLLFFPLKFSIRSYQVRTCILLINFHLIYILIHFIFTGSNTSKSLSITS